ncbi:MAG TPA: M14 family metallopeptidase [Gemmatimonadota bacterium]|nr:M14 family metallopeptidase [Gemmatimonadota bacterium]
MNTVIRFAAGAPASIATGALLALTALAGPAAGQDLFHPDSGSYDPAVPTVAELRGFPTGATFSTDREIERVLAGLAAISDRIRLETYGVSVEGRPLTLAWVSSPANLARLDTLRAVNAGLMTGGAIDLDRHPAFVWLSFGVHGDEAASPEAALELLYHLAAAQDEATWTWLDRSVVAIDPLLNPDGHARYVTWFRSVMGPQPDPEPAAREHRPPWPTGRTNHWYFDLNRDWGWGVQPETRARLAAYLATLPQVHVDFHEMDAGSTYFFFPPAAPVHPSYPLSTADWAATFGAANAAAFDARGWPYFSEEDYDLFYPGYGDSWPSFFGATGMTYEQAGGGEAGVALEREAMGRLTLSDRVRHHLQAALTTIDTAVRHRRERLADFAAFWTPATRVAPGAPAAYLVPPSRAAAALAGLLARQGILVDTLAAGIATAGLIPYPGVSPGPDSLPPGTLFLAGDQPLGRYLAALMTPGGAPPDTSLFFDITGWALPYLYDVPAYSASRVPPVARGRWRPPDAPPPARFDPGTVAFVWEYAAPEDIIAAARLLDRGHRVRVADRDFMLADRHWRRGTFVVSLPPRPESSDEHARTLAATLAELGIRPQPVSTFRTAAGVDLGSDRLRALKAPRVALAAGPAVHATSLGSAWFLLAEKAGIEIDIVGLQDLAADPAWSAESLAGRGQEPIDLERYTAIVLPDGPGAQAYVRALEETGRERLARWLAAGGTLIGVGAGAAYLTAGESGLTDIRLAEKPPLRDEVRRATRAERERDETRDKIPGTLLAATIDTTSVLGYGYPSARAPVMAREPAELALADEGNAWLYADSDPLAGYLPEEARRRLPGTPYAVIAPHGRGRVVLFASDPALRGITHALEKLYLNAVLLAPGS